MLFCQGTGWPCCIFSAGEELARLLLLTRCCRRSLKLLLVAYIKESKNSARICLGLERLYNEIAYTLTTLLRMGVLGHSRVRTGQSWRCSPGHHHGLRPDRVARGSSRLCTRAHSIPTESKKYINRIGLLEHSNARASAAHTNH